MTRRIAIIGGGPAGLATAFHLAARSDGSDVITVYQMGWRLGGKCSTARDPVTGRIHEHGLHVFGGFYHNSWRQLHQLYRRWQLCGVAPVPLHKAFLPVDGCVLTEPDGSIIPVDLPPSDRSRDYDQNDLTGYDAVAALVTIAFSQLVKRRAAFHPLRQATTRLGRKRGDALIREALRLLRAVMPDESPLPRPMRRAAAYALAMMLQPVRDALQTYLRLNAGTIQTRQEACLGAFAAIVTIGLLKDDMLPNRFDRADHMEATAWLRRHGADDIVANSCFVRSAYDYAFAYAEGVTAPPRHSIGAGTAVRGYMNLVLTYAGSLFYHFNGGTAELLAAPYFEVLRAMGVRFAFFHRLDGLTLSDDGRQVVALHGLRQAQVAAGPFNYDPLFAFAGRQCWPSLPLYDQIDGGTALSAWLDRERVSLETDGARVDPPGSVPFTLTRGQDDDQGFTDVVLAIPPAALHQIAAPLVARDRGWEAAMRMARSCCTIAVELRGRDPLGGAGTRGRLLTAHIQPFGTWADMSFLEEGRGPAAHLSYLCGVWPNGVPAESESWADYTEREKASAEAMTADWLAKHLEATLRAGLDRPEGALPIIDDVTVRLNLGRSEAYVQTPPGSVQHRLHPGRAGFDGLYVAGDWTRNGTDAGCYEGAVISGIQCAEALIRDGAWE